MGRALAARLTGAALLVAACDRAAPAPRASPRSSPPVAARVGSAAFETVAPGLAVHRGERAYDAARARVYVVRVDVPRMRFELRPLPEHRFVPLILEGGFGVATNAGFFEPDFGRSGLVLDHGELRAPYHPRAGTGLFVVRAGRASVLDAGEGAPRDADVALQCGPRLVEPDGTLGVSRDDGRRAARTALCVREGGRVVDFVVAFREDGPGGPGLFQLAAWLHEGLPSGESGCEAALNLDGGPSTALAVPAAPDVRRIPPGPVVEALVATPVAQAP